MRMTSVQAIVGTPPLVFAPRRRLQVSIADRLGVPFIYSSVHAAPDLRKPDVCSRGRIAERFIREKNPDKAKPRGEGMRTPMCRAWASYDVYAKESVDRRMLIPEKAVAKRSNNRPVAVWCAEAEELYENAFTRAFRENGFERAVGRRAIAPAR